MLGKGVYSLYSFPRKQLYAVFGTTDIHARQKWSCIYPLLKKFSQDRIYVLDAGCGDGTWTLELATRFPNWIITGVDIKNESIRLAETRKSALKLTNCNFRAADFLEYEAENTFDLILSVQSAHYLVENGHGQRLFLNLSKWLKEDGNLIMLCPRISYEVPFSRFLPKFNWHPVFASQELHSLLQDAGFTETRINPQMNLGITIIKQLNNMVGKNRILRVLFTPIFYILNAVDPITRRKNSSLNWLVIASK